MNTIEENTQLTDVIREGTALSEVTAQKEGTTISENAIDIGISDDKEFNLLYFLKNKYVLVAILLAVAGGVYGLTYTFDSLQINFTLYCCSVWFVCLAFIFLANYTRSSPSN